MNGTEGSSSGMLRTVAVPAIHGSDHCEASMAKSCILPFGLGACSRYDKIGIQVCGLLINAW